MSSSSVAVSSTQHEIQVQLNESSFSEVPESYKFDYKHYFEELSSSNQNPLLINPFIEKVSSNSVGYAESEGEAIEVVNLKAGYFFLRKVDGRIKFK